jgi:hypothetical protein
MTPKKIKPPSRIRIKFVNVATEQTATVDQPLKDYEQRSLIPHCKIVSAEANGEVHLHDLATACHEIVKARALHFEDGVDFLVPALNFKQFLPPPGIGGKCLNVVVAENASTGLHGERKHFWEIETSHQRQRSGVDLNFAKESPATTRALNFVRAFLENMHPSVQIFEMKLPHLRLFYENQSWVGNRFFKLRRVHAKKDFFEVNTGVMAGVDGSWDGKEIPGIIEMIGISEDIRISYHTYDEMPPSAVSEILTLTIDARRLFVCAKLAEGFSSKSRQSRLAYSLSSSVVACS